MQRLTLPGSPLQRWRRAGRRTASEDPAPQGAPHAWPTVVSSLVSAEVTNVAVVGRRTGRMQRLLPDEAERSVSLLELSADDSEADRHVQLAGRGPFDLILDDTGEPNGSGARLKELVFHLREGGTLAMRGAHRYRRTDQGRGLRRLLRSIRRAGTVESPPGRYDTPYITQARTDIQDRSDAFSLFEAIEGWRSRGPHLLVTRRLADSRIKVREAEAEAVMNAASVQFEALMSVPAVSFRSRCVLRESAETRMPHQPERYDVPDIWLRSYDDVVVWPRQAVTQGRFVLPESFRHQPAPTLRSKALVDLAPRFARTPGGEEDLQELEGTWYHLDNEFRGHFGHLMTEQLSRMWAWDWVKERWPETKALVTLNRGRGLSSWELEIYEAAGIGRDDIVLIEQPARVEQLVAPSPMLCNHYFVHPEIATTWRRVGESLAAESTRTDFGKRIFCSRSIRKRTCHNRAEVEQLFAAHGFDIVFPEEHSVPDQVAMFRHAEVIAGFAGSGLFQLALVDEPKDVITIASERYMARNEYLMASVLGHSLNQVTCAPDDPQAFQSDFSVDWDREGRWLRDVLNSL